ncbi:MAG TPA: hypothetical protein VIJ94_17525 [Caulobacteraceae bacterium]
MAHIDGAAEGISAAGFDSPDLHVFADLIRRRAQKVRDMGPAKNSSSDV